MEITPQASEVRPERGSLSYKLSRSGPEKDLDKDWTSYVPFCARDLVHKATKQWFAFCISLQFTAAQQINFRFPRSRDSGIPKPLQRNAGKKFGKCRFSYYRIKRYQAEGQARELQKIHSGDLESASWGDFPWQMKMAGQS